MIEITDSVTNGGEIANIATDALVIIVDKKDIAEFKKLVARAMNTWQDPSPEIIEFSNKLFADITPTPKS